MNEAGMENVVAKNDRSNFKIPRWRLILEVSAIVLLSILILAPPIFIHIGAPALSVVIDYVDHPIRYFSYESQSAPITTIDKPSQLSVDRLVSEIQMQGFLLYMMTGVYLIPWSASTINVLIRQKRQPFHKIIQTIFGAILGMLIGIVAVILKAWVSQLADFSIEYYLVSLLIDLIIVAVFSALGAIFPFWNRFEAKAT
jgi:hypothetical protein